MLTCIKYQNNVSNKFTEHLNNYTSNVKFALKTNNYLIKIKIKIILIINIEDKPMNMYTRVHN